MNPWPIYLSGVLTGLAIGMVILQVAISDIKRSIRRIIEREILEREQERWRWMQQRSRFDHHLQALNQSKREGSS